MTVVTALAGWSSLAVTVTAPAASETSGFGSETVSVLGAGLTTVAVTESIPSDEP